MTDNVPQTSRPLGPTTVRISFFYICRSCARWSRSCPLRPHQFLMSRSQSLHGRPLRAFPSILANIACFISLLSFILHMCPNSLSFRLLIVSTHVFHYDRIATQLRRNCDRTVTHNCEKLRRTDA